MENRELLDAGYAGQAATTFLGDLAHLRNDVATSALALVNAAQPSPTNTPTLISMANQWSKAKDELGADVAQTRQAFLQLEYAVLEVYPSAIDTLLADFSASLSSQSPNLSPSDPGGDSRPTVGSGSGSGSQDTGASAPSSTRFLPKASGSGSGSGSSSGSGGGGGYSLNWVGGSNAPNTPPGWNQDMGESPIVTSPPNQTNNEGDTVSLQIQASMGTDEGTDNDSLSYATLDLPPGLSINASTGLITGTAASGDAAESGGTYNPVIVVSDAEGTSAETGLTWTITNNASVAPVLTNPGIQTNLRGDSVSLQINASQNDNNPLTYDASNLPTGLGIDPDTGLISGTVDPSATLGVPYAVTVTATDDTTNLSASQSFNWTINATNVAPALTSPGNQTNSTGDDVSLQLSATDADGDNLTYTATGLPPGLVLDPTAGTISGTLPNSAASSTPYNVTVTASDGMAKSSQSFTWMVNAVSLTNPSDQSNLDGDSVSLQLLASDANNAALTYSASNLPSGLSINNSIGLISGTISSTADASSPYAVTVTATDSNNNSVSQAFNWTVARVGLNPVSNQENQEGTAVSLQPSATDHEGTPTYSATGLPPGLSISSTGLISGTVGIGAFGSSPYQVTVTATDGSATSSQSLVWTVTPRVALVNPGPQSNAEGDTVSVQLSATSPGGNMSYSASGLPPGLSINSSTGLISGTISSGDSSSSPYTVTVTANDGTSSSSQTFNWTVAVINLVSPGDQTSNDGDTVSLSLTTGYHGSGTLSYSATGLPTGLSINSQTGQITGTISGTADTNSPYSATVTATDGTNTSSQTFNWTVNAVVSIDPIDDQSDAVGDSLSMQVSASDANNSALTYSATGLPSALTINSTTGLISSTIAVGDDAHSPYTVSVTVTDSAGNSASQSFNWTVTHVSLVNPGSLQSVDGAGVSLQMQGGDADGDTVTYTATGLPPGLSTNSSGLISGTIASNADTNSPYMVTVTASDGVHTTTQTFEWVVSQVLLNAPSDQTNTEGDNVSLQLQGMASSGSLSYNASGLPSGLSLNSTTGLISGTLAAGDAANGPYTVDISGGNGTVSTSQTFTWTVNPVVNLGIPPDQSNVEGNSVSLQLSATDALSKALTYSAANLPSGLSINSGTGLISGTISSGDSANSPYAVTVTASDGTYSSSAEFTWTVMHTDTTALTMTNPGTQVNVTGDSVYLPINASDPDGIDTLIYSATGLPNDLVIDPASGIIFGTVADQSASATPYQVTVTADDGNDQTVSQTFNWIINPAPITVTPSPISAVEGADTGSISVATFTTPDTYSQAGDFVATIDYGDGNSDYGTVSGSNGSFTVADNHVYAEAGTYTVKITIANTFTGGTTTATTTASVADAPLTLTSGFQLGDPANDSQNLFIVATLTDANPYAKPTDFTVTINGASIPSNDVQSQGDGRFLILKPGGYANPFPNSNTETNPISISVQDDDGSSASTSSTITVGFISSQVSGTMNTWLFFDSNPNAAAGQFTANVNWGDGTSSPCTVSYFAGGNGSPTEWIVNAPPHTYAQDSYSQPNGRYQITVTVTSPDGNLTGIQYVSVERPPLDLYTDNVASPANSLSLNNVAVASFTVPETNDGPSEFSATINWGDNTSSAGVIVNEGGGIFEIFGSHTYASAGEYPVSVELSQEWSTGMIPVDEGDLFADVGEPSIQGPHVVLGFADPSKTQNVIGYNYVYTTTVPGVDLQKVIPTFNWSNGANVNPLHYEVSQEANRGQNTTTITIKVQFNNEPNAVEIGLTYQLPGANQTLKVKSLTVWVVQLTIASNPAPTIQKHTRFNSEIDPVTGKVNVDTRGAVMYSFEGLKNPDEVDKELALGLVSFKVTVIMKGPGANNQDGVDLVRLGWVQDITRATVGVIYKKGSAMYWPSGEAPWLDSGRDKAPYYADPGTGGSTAFTRSSIEQDAQNAPGGGKSAVVVSLDAPGIWFYRKSIVTEQEWTRTVGSLYFSTNLAAYIDGQPTVYSWLGAVPWSVSYIGSNDGSGKWVNTGSAVTLGAAINQAPLVNPKDASLEALTASQTSLPFVTTTKASLGLNGAFNPLAPTFYNATFMKQTRTQHSFYYFAQ